MGDFSSFLVPLLLVLWFFSIMLHAHGHNTCSKRFNYFSLCPSPLGDPLQHTSLSDPDDMYITLEHHNDSKSSNGRHCTFYKSKVIVEAIHVTSEPWDYSYSSKCKYKVLFYQNPDDKRENRQVCRKGFGLRLGKERHNDDSKNVYFWQNFSLDSRDIHFTDYISNYDRSEYDLMCAKQPQYAQIMFTTSVNNNCFLLVQEYEIKGPGQRHCNNEMYQYHVCGLYPCSEKDNVLTRVKLRKQHNELASGTGKNDSNSPSKPNSKPGATTSVLSATSDGNMTVSIEHTDNTSWTEGVVVTAFPVVGIILVMATLFHLRNQHANLLKEKESGIPPDEEADVDNTSTNSYDKEGLSL